MMTIKKMMKKILRWLRKDANDKFDSASMITHLMRKLINTEDGEISCDDVQSVLAELAELQRQGENIASVMPLVHKHLEMCPDCMEEYQALLRMLDFE